jgi:hypothetical protein
MGFGESIMRLMGQDNAWIARGVAIALVLLLLGNNHFFHLKLHRERKQVWGGKHVIKKNLPRLRDRKHTSHWIKII